MDQHIPQLTCAPDSVNEFAITDKWYIDLYDPLGNVTRGDWCGIPGHSTLFVSDTPGTKAEIVAPASVTPVTNSHWEDINNTGTVIDATDPSNVVINCLGINGFVSTQSSFIVFSED